MKLPTIDGGDGGDDLLALDGRRQSVCVVWLVESTEGRLTESRPFLAN